MSTRSAIREVSTTTEATIEKVTARKWADRALACYQLYCRLSHLPGSTAWLLRAEHYRDEALEHAAMVGDQGRTVGVLQREMDALRPQVKAPRHVSKHRRSRRA